MIRSYRDLDVWRVAILLAQEAHALAAEVPRVEAGGLADQLRRSSLSVSANIAEGNGRARTAQYRHFLSIARGSLNETESHLLAAVELGHVPPARADIALQLVARVGRMLTALDQALAGRQQRDARRRVR